MGAVLAAVLGSLASRDAAAPAASGRRSARQAAAEGRSAVNTPRWTFAMVTHSGDGDTFWDIVQKRRRAGGREGQHQVPLLAQRRGQQQAQLVQTAIDKKVDGLIVTLAKPDAMKAVVAKAVKAGIPVITVNSGSEQSKAFGALTHIGQDETIAGEAVGERAEQAGPQEGPLRPPRAGQRRPRAALRRREEDLRRHRCRTCTSTAPTCPTSSPSIEAKLQADKSIDAVVTLGAPFADAAVKAKETAGSKAEIDTFDLNAKVAAGAQGPARSASPSTSSPTSRATRPSTCSGSTATTANVLGGGLPVLTGPQIITKDDADALEEYTKRGTR